MRKRIIITGITGLVGKSLAKACLGAGYDVVGVARNLKKAAGLLPDEVHLLSWEEVVSGLQQENLEGAYAFINLVGENIGSSRWTRRRRDQILGSRVGSVEQMGDLISRLTSKPRLFLQASAVGIYGFNLSRPVDETAFPGSGFLAEVCGKLEAAAGSLIGTRAVMMRFGVVLDTREGALAKILMPVKKFRIGAFPSPARNILSWIHIKDLTGAVMHILAQQDPAPVYNLCAPQPVAYKDLYALIARLCRAIFLLPVPFFVLKIPFGAWMVRETLQASQPVVPAKLTDEGYRFAFPDYEVALKDLLT